MELLISIHCKYNENGNCSKNDKLNETELHFKNEIVIEIIVKPEPERKRKLCHRHSHCQNYRRLLQRLRSLRRRVAYSSCSSKNHCAMVPHTCYIMTRYTVLLSAVRA